MGAALCATDLRSVLELTLEARSARDRASFLGGVTSGLRALVACEALGLNEIDPVRGTALVYTDPPDYGLSVPRERFATLIRQHPVAGPRSRGDLRTRRLSEMISARALHRLELYQEAYRELGIEDQIVLGLPGDALVAIVLSRSRRTFTDRDREVLELARPHLARAYQDACEREQVARLVWRLEEAIEDLSAAVIQIDRAGRVAHASDYALELLGAHFPWRPGVASRLPDSVAAWLRRGKPAVLRVDGPRGRLTIRRLAAGEPSSWEALLIEEHATACPSLDALRRLGLTAREAQVARLLARGKRNGQIAHELGIREGTVRKHLEHLYRTLGVGSRGEAIARVLVAPPARGADRVCSGR